MPSIENILDLTELQKTSRGDKEFENKMLISFIVSTTQSLNRMKNGLNQQNCKEIGEAAHKMTSSFRYFKLTTLVKNLENIEEYCLNSNVPEKASFLVTETIENIEDLIHQLKSENI